MTRTWIQPLFHKAGGGAAPPGLQGFTKQGVPHPTPRPTLKAQCRGAGSHGGGFNWPCHLLGRGGQALGLVQEKSRPPGASSPCAVGPHRPPWPLHTPGVTVDLDDLPGLVGGLVVHTRAVLLGHAASAPVGQQPHGADTARYTVSAELQTGGCPSVVPLPPAQGRRPPGPPGSTATPFQPTHTVHVQGVAASHALGPRRVRRGVAAVEEHHRGHAPCGDSHAGRASRPAAALPSVMGGARGPRGRGPGEAAPVLCSVAPRQLSLPLTHELRETGVGAVWAAAPLPLPRPRPGPRPCHEGGRAPSTGL